MQEPPPTYTPEEQRIWRHLILQIGDANSGTWNNDVSIVLKENPEQVIQVMLSILCDFGNTLDMPPHYAHPPHSTWYEGVEGICRLGCDVRTQHLVLPCISSLACILSLPLDPKYYDPMFIIDAFVALEIGHVPEIIPVLLNVLQRPSLQNIEFQSVLDDVKRLLLSFADTVMQPYSLIMSTILKR